jgi:hypothetical protein
MEIGFDEFIDSEIKPNLEELGNLRTEIRRTGIKNKITFSILLIVGLFFTYWEIQSEAETESQGENIFLVVAFICILLFAYARPHTFVSNTKIIAFKSKFKFKIIGSAIRFIDPNLKYKPIFKTSKQQIKKSELFGSFTECREDDGVIGELEDCKIQLSELHVMKDLKRTFDGLFIKIKIDKEINNDRLSGRIDNLQRKINLPIKSSFKNDCLYFGIEYKSTLFEISLLKSNDEQIVKDIWLLHSILIGIREIARHHSEKFLMSDI